MFLRCTYYHCSIVKFIYFPALSHLCLHIEHSIPFTYAPSNNQTAPAVNLLLLVFVLVSLVRHIVVSSIEGNARPFQTIFGLTWGQARIEDAAMFGDAPFADLHHLC